MPELVYRIDFPKPGPNRPVMPMAIPLNYLPEKDVLISSVFLFSKVISLGPYLIAFSLQSGNCLFLKLASPKGGAQLWYQAALWQHHKFKSHLYNHGNKSIDFSFRVVVFSGFQHMVAFFSFLVWRQKLICMKNTTMVVKTVNIPSELLQKEPNDPFIFESFVFSFSSVTDKRHPRP